MGSTVSLKRLLVVDWQYRDSWQYIVIADSQWYSVSEMTVSSNVNKETFSSILRVR